MKKSILSIFEAAEKGGYKVTEINCNKSGCKVWLERDYLFIHCYFDLSKNEFKHHYLSVMDDKFILAKGVNFSK
jgi:hypothetical protein